MSEGKPKGLPASLVIVAVIIALIIGAVAGYFIKPTPPAEVKTETFTKTIATTISTTITPKKPYEGYYIIVITGDEADPFTIPIAKGARDAAEHFGCKVDVFFSKGWADEEFLKNFRTAISLHPDGIAICPLGGREALEPEFDRAYKEGIIVTLQNVDIPEFRKKYAPYCGYIGQELYSSGYRLAEAAVKKFGFKAGDRAAIFSGAWGEPERAQRAYGALDALTKAGMIVDKVEHPPAVYADPGMGTSYVAGYVSAHPDVKLIIFDGGGTTSATDSYMKAIGKKPGEIKVAGFDLTPGAIRSIKAGYLQLTLDQQPYLYGYLTTLNLLLTKKIGIMGLYIDTGGGIVDETNVDLVAKLAEEGYR
ncbi:MAG: substrate-binding domain-containing protein [Candidatus Methanomethylicia archaeon]